MTLIEADYSRYQTQLLTVRRIVFIDEQGVPEELEVDDADPISQHLLLFAKDQPVATGRLTPDGHIGRLAVLKSCRNRGYGSTILKKLEQLARSRNLTEVVLAAQVTALSFYQKRGYQACGSVFMDAGIEHLMMKKVLR